MEKTEVMRVRLTPAEKAIFTAAARREGMSLSAWARWRLRLSAQILKRGGKGS